MMTQKEITEYVEDIKPKIDSYVLVANGNGMYNLLEKNYHLFCIIEDDKAAIDILNQLKDLGIEVLPDHDTFKKKISSTKAIPQWFP